MYIRMKAQFQIFHQNLIKYTDTWGTAFSLGYFIKIYWILGTENYRLLPFTVLIQTGFQKGEGYAENIPALWQAQQIYTSNIRSDYWEQNHCFSIQAATWLNTQTLEAQHSV